MAPELTTSRLLLRHWRPDDRDPFAALNADPAVMEYFPAPLSRSESDGLIERASAFLECHAFGLWAVEAPIGFIGFVGLSVPRFEAPFTPCVEIGWRLARAAWGHGYATEGARAVLEHGFGTEGLDDIVSMTAVGNARSRAVMERLGMTRDPADDFDHPTVMGTAVQRHVLYRLARADWALSRTTP